MRVEDGRKMERKNGLFPQLFMIKYPTQGMNGRCLVCFILFVPKQRRGVYLLPLCILVKEIPMRSPAERYKALLRANGAKPNKEKKRLAPGRGHHASGSTGGKSSVSCTPNDTKIAPRVVGASTARRGFRWFPHSSKQAG